MSQTPAPARALALLLAGLVGAWLVVLNFASLAAVASHAKGFSALHASDWAAVRFTLWQAFWSAAVSVLLAIPLARALSRRHFVGRGALVLLLGAPFILPTLVAVLGLLAVWGRAGWVSEALVATGGERISIYGPHGVVLAHVFFNLPLATRILLQGWATIPAERFRLAASLGLRPAQYFRHLEGPMLRDLLPGAFVLIFLICLTSFAVALALGGGPKASTVELAIYQAFRFDNDLGRAALLAALQFALCAVAGLVAARVAVPSGLGGGLDRVAQRFDAHVAGRAAWDGIVIALAAAFLLLPLVALVWGALPHLATLPAEVWGALRRSVTVALGATALTTIMALALAHGILALPRSGSAVLEGLGLAALAASPLVVGTGLYLLLRPHVAPRDWALVVTLLVNAGMALPFVLRLILPEMRAIKESHGRLADSLGLHGWARLRGLTLPRLRRPLGFGAGLTAALSMGDLGVIMLFAEREGATLPMVLYRLMNSYRMDTAMAAALLLMLTSLLLFWAFDRWGRRDVAA